MKQLIKISLFIPAAVLMFVIDIPPQAQFPYFQLGTDAHAVFGVRRRMFRRGVVIGSTAEASEAVVNSQQAPPPVQQQTVEPVQQSAAGLLPMGKVVATLPSGCTEVQSSGVEYYHCGVNYYRATFQGNKLVYVTAQPN